MSSTAQGAWVTEASPVLQPASRQDCTVLAKRDFTEADVEITVTT